LWATGALQGIELWEDGMSRSRWFSLLVAVTVLALVPGTAIGKPRSGSFKQVGHEPLMNRGMNAAIAIQGRYAYIGSRTDGGHPGMPHGGIMVVDIKRPAKPRLVGGPLDAKSGESSRELRVWKSQKVLIVLNTNCGVGEQLHHCTQPSISNFRFYDIKGANARNPGLLRQLNVDTHEFYLWQDPRNRGRALIFAGNASSTCATRGGSPSCPFAVWDISQIRQGKDPVALFMGGHGYSSGSLHSLTVSNDDRPLMFALTETASLQVYDATSYEHKGTKEGIGISPYLLYTFGE